MDDFAATVTTELRLLRTEMREEFRALRTEMHDEFRAMRADMSSLQRQLAKIGWGLAVALVGAIVAIVVAIA